MNIYLLNEGGEAFCIKANSMSKAVDICEKIYLEEIKEEKNYGKLDKSAIENERKYYHEQILQSCSLVGVLKNNFSAI